MNTEGLLNWIDTHSSVLVYAGLFSFLMTLTAAVSVPFIINMLSDDYFIKEKRRSNIKTIPEYFILIISLVIKNTIGILLFISGFAMLFMPGQGLLTLFISFLFIDYPGKWKLQRRVVRNREIHNALNWIRRKGGKDNFKIP
jgi:hypothetical protein